jgi:hypothetical protein
MRMIRWFALIFAFVPSLAWAQAGVTTFPSGWGQSGILPLAVTASSQSISLPGTLVNGALVSIRNTGAVDAYVQVTNTCPATVAVPTTGVALNSTVTDVPAGGITALNASGAVCIGYISTGTTTLLVKVGVGSPYVSLPGGAGGGGGSLALGGQLSGTVANAVVSGPIGPTTGTLNGLVDIRQAPYSATCDGVTNVASAVNAAVAGGYKKIFLAANCFYVPTSNTTPAGIEIDGQDWLTSTISVATRTSQNLLLGSGSILRNVNIISEFCDQTAPPAATQKTCPIGYAVNNSDSTNGLYAYPYQSNWAVSGPTYTQGGVALHDLPNWDSTVFGAGADSIYTQTGSGGSGGSAAAGASGLRVVTQGAGDNGILVLDGYNDPTTTDAHNGVTITEYGDNNGASVSSLRIDRIGDTAGVTQSLEIDDASAASSLNSAPMIQLSPSAQSTGNVFSVFQGTTAFSGNIINLNAGNASGTFTGNFINAAIAGASQYAVDASGDQGQAGRLTVGRVSPPTTVGGSPLVNFVNTNSANLNLVSSLWSNDAIGPSAGCLKSRNTTPGSHTIVNAGDTICHLGIPYADDGTSYRQVGDTFWTAIGSPATGKVGTSFEVDVQNVSTGATVNGFSINGNTGAFAVGGNKVADTSGNVFAVALTASGAANFSTLTASSPVFTDASKNLTNTGPSGYPQSASTGIAISAGGAISSNAVDHISYQPGLLTAVNPTKAAFHKYSKAATVDNLEGSAATFSCVSNPTITMFECGTSTTCATPTSIGTVTVTAAGTVVDGSVSSSAITAGDYVAFAITGGTCASVDIAATAQVHSN